MLKGVIIRDYSGKLIMKDGSRIVRINQEPFVQAIERMLQPKSNFVTLAAGINYQDLSQYADDEYDADDDEVYPAQRVTRQTRLNGRKEAGDKVYPQPTKTAAPAKQPVTIPTAQANQATNGPT